MQLGKQGRNEMGFNYDLWEDTFTKGQLQKIRGKDLKPVKRKGKVGFLKGNKNVT